MGRKELRVRIMDDGRLEVVDPGFDSLPLIEAIDTDFRIKRSDLPGFTAPRFLQMRYSGVGIEDKDIDHWKTDELWEVHEKLMQKMRTTQRYEKKDPGEASVLDLKIELAARMLTQCRLCGRQCGVDRFRGERGICHLGIEGLVSEHFVHICEEPPINPSLLISLYGCGLRCRLCQQWPLLEPASKPERYLDPSLWSKLETEGARSLSFIGGNPDESLYPILLFLNSAPKSWRLPIVWNSNAYGTLEVVRLLEGIVDAYVPDFKYWNERCARDLSSAPDYPVAAKASISEMLSQKVPVIVRILVLPGHLNCCHKPVIDVLASMKTERLLVSVRGQYCPGWRITRADGPLARRVTREETEAVLKKALMAGLVLVD